MIGLRSGVVGIAQNAPDLWAQVSREVLRILAAWKLRLQLRDVSQSRCGANSSLYVLNQGNCEAKGPF